MNRHRFTSTLILFALAFLFTAPSPVMSQDRAKLESKISSLMQQLLEKEREFLSPGAEDESAFAGFVAQPDAGIIRLLPREKYDGKLLTHGGGAFYSFARLVHDYGFGSDIMLERDQFGVGFAGADFGFLVRLGDVPLEGVTMEHAGVRFLADFTSPSVLPGAREQYRRGHPGFDVAGFTYANRTAALLNTTYALRSINYDRSDLLVAFRVVRQDSDASLILLYKILKKFPKPVLGRE